jgi:hypothetical protein
VIGSHKDLLGRRSAINARLEADPSLAAKLVLNPVLALHDAGVDVSPEIASHILHTLQQSPRSSERRRGLETSLAAELGEQPRPEDPQWVSRILFEKLKIAPLDTKAGEPRYTNALDEAAERRLNALRPAFRKSVVRHAHGIALDIPLQRQALHQLDLQSAAPKLEAAAVPPAEVTIRDLYFYKDAHPVARDLLELALLRCGRFFTSRSRATTRSGASRTHASAANTPSASRFRNGLVSKISIWMSIASTEEELWPRKRLSLSFNLREPSSGMTGR